MITQIPQHLSLRYTEPAAAAIVEASQQPEVQHQHVHSDTELEISWRKKIREGGYMTSPFTVFTVLSRLRSLLPSVPQRFMGRQKIKWPCQSNTTWSVTVTSGHPRSRVESDYDRRLKNRKRFRATRESDGTNDDAAKHVRSSRGRLNKRTCRRLHFLMTGLR